MGYWKPLCLSRCAPLTTESRRIMCSVTELCNWPIFLHTIVNFDACSNVFQKCVNQEDNLELALSNFQLGVVAISSLWPPGMTPHKLFPWVNRCCQLECWDPCCRFDCKTRKEKERESGMLTCFSRQREATYIIYCNQISSACSKVCTREVSFS